MIEYQFTITLDQYLEAQALYMRQELHRSRWRRWALSAAILLGLAVIIFSNPSPWQFLTEHFGLLLVLFLPIYMLFPRLFRRQVFKKRFTKEKQNLTDAHVTIDDEGYHIEVPDIGSGVANWPGVNSWHEGGKVILLRCGLLMRIIPKDALTADGLAQLHGLLNKHIGSVDVVR